MLSSRYRLLAWASSIGMALVLLAGAIVTKTDSGRGCGDDWPLCNGKFIPAYTLESMIEYSHRMSTGVVGVIVVMTFIYTWRYLRNHKEALLYAGGTLFFTIIQALMGAAAVKWPQQPTVMALHFGISLLAVASSVLLVLWCFQMKRAGRMNTNQFIPRKIYLAASGMWIYCYGVIYLGAYIRHMEAEGGCLDWPLCNGQLIPYLSGASGIVFGHRVAAAILIVSMVLFYFFINSKDYMKCGSGLKTGALLALVLVIAQIASGGLFVVTLHNEFLYLFANLLHNVLAMLLFCVLTAIAVHSWKWRRAYGSLFHSIE